MERDKEQERLDNYKWDESRFIKLASYVKKSRSLEQRIDDLEQHIVSKLDLILHKLENRESEDRPGSEL